MTDKLDKVREKLTLTPEEITEIEVSCTFPVYDFREKKHLVNWEEFTTKLREAQQDKDFNTPITIEGGVCPHCVKGKYIMHDGYYTCRGCGGTGKLPDKTKTIKQLIEEAMG